MFATILCVKLETKLFLFVIYLVFVSFHLKRLA